MSPNHHTNSKLALKFASLTGREQEVLSLIYEEKTNREIASCLSISPRTVDRHRENLLLKLDVKNTVGLVKAYYSFQIS